MDVSSTYRNSNIGDLEQENIEDSQSAKLNKQPSSFFSKQKSVRTHFTHLGSQKNEDL